MGNTPNTHPQGLNTTRHPLPTPGDTETGYCAHPAHRQHIPGNTAHPNRPRRQWHIQTAQQRKHRQAWALGLCSRWVWGHECGHGAMTHMEPTAIYLLCPLAMFSQERAL